MRKLTKLELNDLETGTDRNNERARTGLQANYGVPTSRSNASISSVTSTA